jgi:hypothetical protein
MKRALIWRCHEGDLCGGLGDEIRGLAFTLYAAIAANRTFLVSWKKLGQDVLGFFKANGMDVSVPTELEQCVESTTSFTDLPENDIQKLLGIAQEETACKAWNINFGADGLFKHEHRSLLQQYLPWLEPVKPFYAIGCAMWFLFQPVSPSDHLRTTMGEHISAIHYRISDSALGNAALAKTSEDEHAIREALQCADKHKLSNVLFLSGSEAVKNLAVELSNHTVKVSKGAAKHFDHDAAQLSPQEFENAVWNDFVALQQVDYLIFNCPSSLIGHYNFPSGFSNTAASMSFLPTDHFLDGRTCSAVVTPD